MLSYVMDPAMRGEELRTVLRRIDLAMKLGHAVTVDFGRSQPKVTFTIDEALGPLRVCPRQYEKDKTFARRGSSRDPRWTECYCSLSDGDDGHPTMTLEDLE